MGKNVRGFNLIFILLLGALLLMVWSSSMNHMQDNYTRGALEKDLAEGNVSSAVISQNKETPTGSVTVMLKGGDSRTVYVTNVEEAIQLFEDSGIDPIVRDVPKESWFMNSMLPVLIVGVVIMVFFFMMMNAQNAGAGAGSNKMMNFGKSRARMSVGSENKITLKEVAGLKEEKEELQEIVDFLREPSKFTKVGARIPKGVLLEGPPGTGKTLLAKAIAGEANVPFSVFQALISWRCLLVWALPGSVTCSRKPRRTHPVLYLSMKLTLWQDAEAPAWAAAMMKGSRP